jgi:ABC-type transporter Mla MlaB component
MTENFNVDIKDNKSQLTMVFSGQLTINSIAKITESIKSHLKKPSAVNITVIDADNIDLTFIQLLKAIENSGKKKGFDVNISISASEDIASLLKNAGFAGYLIDKN